MQLVNSQLETDNDAMRRTIIDLKKKKDNKQVADLQRQLRDMEAKYFELDRLYNDAVRENEELALSNYQLRQSKTSLSESPWISKENISSYDIGINLEVRFDYCVLPDGTEYIDARKYQNGKPTRKGICLDLDDFDKFLRFGRTAWSRVTSGLFNNKFRRK